MKIPPHQHYLLGNGVTLILLPRPGVPLIAFDAVVRGGARLDPEGSAGLASITAELLTRGAGARDAYGFADAVEGAGGSMDAGAHGEALILHGQFLSRDRALMLELLADALQRPRFEAEEFDSVRDRRIEFIKAAKDSEPQSLIGSYGRALLFGAHPFGRPISGSEHSLAALTREHVWQFYQQHVGAERLTLVFAGDFDADQMLGAVTAGFEGWRPAGTPLPALAAPERERGRKVLLVDAPGSAQSYFWIGNVGVARSYARRAALEITNTAFGGSFGSMLMQALRVKNGLTYSAGSSFRRGSVPAEFAIGSFTQTASTRQAVELALSTLDTLKAEGASERSLDSARSYILGQYPLAFETSADWAAALAELDLYGLPDSYIDGFAEALRQVDAPQSRQVVADAFPNSQDVAMVLIGDAAQIRPDAGRWGAMQEMPLAAPVFYPLS